MRTATESIPYSLVRSFVSKPQRKTTAAVNYRKVLVRPEQDAPRRESPMTTKNDCKRLSDVRIARCWSVIAIEQLPAEIDISD